MSNQEIGKSPETKAKISAFEIDRNTNSVGTKNGYQLYENGNRVYSAANKPTAKDVGAVSDGDGISALQLRPIYVKGDSTINGELTVAVQGPAFNSAAQKGYVDEHIKTVADRVTKLENNPGGVSSVNGKTGAVVLSASDVDAASIIEHNTLTNKVNTLGAADVGAMGTSSPRYTGTMYNDTLTSSSKRVLQGSGTSLWVGNDSLTNMYMEFGSSGNLYAKKGTTNYKIYHEGNKPTAADVGALGSNDSTLTGTTTVETLNLSKMVTSSKQALRSDGSSLYIGNTSQTGVYLETSNGYACVKGGATNYRIYHEGNKPSLSSLGAAASSHTHSNYASSTHTHTEYATSGHTHSNYASTSSPTFTGNLTYQGVLYCNSLTTTNKQVLNGSNYTVNVGNSSISNVTLETSNGYAYVKSGSTSYRIYHEGFKPAGGNGSDPGSVVASWPIGSYCLAHSLYSSSLNPGNTISGSSLRPASAGNNWSGSAMSGTWRAMGFAYFDNGTDASTTLFVRIS